LEIPAGSAIISLYIINAPMLSDDTCQLQFVIKYFQTAATTELLYINVEDHPGELIRRVISKTPFGRCHHLCHCPYCRVEWY